MKKSVKKAALTGLLLLFVLIMPALPAQAATKKYVSTWRTQNGKVYYYNSKGKKATGLTKIGKKYYYFDSKGIQRSGWKKVKNEYYFFRISSNKMAYMMTSQTINGITLDKKGRADQSGSNLRKLNLMVTANQVMESITKPGMSKGEKLRLCFDYTKTHYKYYSWRSFRATSDWAMTYAEDMFYRGRGDCFAYGAAFAFLANAVGIKNVYAVSSGGHGWAEAKGKVYDPDWALVSKVDSYYAMPYSLSGVGGRPNYAPNRAYMTKI